MKHLIAAVALAASASVSANTINKSDNCMSAAELSNFFLKLMERGQTPSAIITPFRDGLKNPEELRYVESMLRIALLSAAEGKKSGAQHIGEIYAICMK